MFYKEAILKKLAQFSRKALKNEHFCKSSCRPTQKTDLHCGRFAMNCAKVFKVAILCDTFERLSVVRYIP